MSNNQTPDTKKLTTGICRLSYVHLLEAHATTPGGQAKFGVTLLIPKSDYATKQKIDAAINAAIAEGVSSKWGGQRPQQPAVPLYDGDGLRPNGETFRAECKGHWIITASSMQKPQVVDINISPILDATQIYSGMYGRASIRFFPYFNAGKKGIGCGLNHVQKTADGEPLSSVSRPEDDFSAPWDTPQAPAPRPTQPPAPAPAQPAYPGYVPMQQPYAAPAYPAAPVPVQQPYQAPVQQQYQAPAPAPIQQPYPAQAVYPGAYPADPYGQSMNIYGINK